MDHKFEIKNNWLDGPTVERLEATKNTKTKPRNFAVLDTIVIHYTAGSSGKSSARFLARPDIGASAHLVVDRTGDSPTVYQLVPFNLQSWHAGVSSYMGRSGYNKYSIGIELDNAGALVKAGSGYKADFGTIYDASEAVFDTHRNESKPRYWHRYPEGQIEVTEDICRKLIKAYPTIKHIVGHEEISPGRKIDPGPAFPLDRLRRRIFERRDNDETDGLTGHVTSNVLNIRSGAGVQHNRIAMPLRINQEVKILEEVNGWYRVKTEIEGWVSKAYINTEKNSD